MPNFNEALNIHQGTLNEKVTEELNLDDYADKMLQASRSLGFGFYEAMMAFRQELLRTYSEDELRHSALYHVLIGSTPESYHNKKANDFINQQIKEFIDKSQT